MNTSVMTICAHCAPACDFYSPHSLLRKHFANTKKSSQTASLFLRYANPSQILEDEMGWGGGRPRAPTARAGLANIHSSYRRAAGANEVPETRTDPMRDNLCRDRNRARGGTEYIVKAI